MTSNEMKERLKTLLSENPPKRKRAGALDNEECAMACRAFLEGKIDGSLAAMSIPWFNKVVIQGELGIKLTNNAVQKHLMSRFPDLFNQAIHSRTDSGDVVG